jgi:hypothetical protein
VNAGGFLAGSGVAQKLSKSDTVIERDPESMK